MAPYLPRNGQSGSPFSEGGALYALGLIHANHGQQVRQFLLEALRTTSNELIQHGACLGLGESCMLAGVLRVRHACLCYGGGGAPHLGPLLHTRILHIVPTLIFFL